MCHAQHWWGVPSLDGYRNPLEEELEGPWLSSLCLDSSANLFQQGQCLRSKHSRGLDSEGHQVVASTEVGVLFCLSLLCLDCNRTGLPGSKGQMWGGIGIWACCIPYQGRNTLPRQHCCPIWRFPICTRGARGLQVWRDFGWCQCPPDQFVDCCMLQVSTLAHPAAETM